VSPDWADAVSKQLLDRRVVRVFGRLDDALVADLAAQLWSLDALGDDPITLLLSISGGSVSATLATIDVLDVIGVDLQAVCVGGISGPPVGILAAAQHRQAAPSARFFLRDEHISFQGSYRDLEGSARLHHQQRSQVLARLAESTRGRRSLEEVLSDFERGLALDSHEARSYGIIDSVTSTSDGIVRLPRHSTEPGFNRG
jgi:ATP-dependent Clp protease, protease subunit